MGKLIYATNTSLDGFTEDANGSFDWSVPDDEVHEFYNDMVRGVGIQLLGRRMYETMAVWETEPSFFEDSAVLADFAAAWQDSDKLVYSTTLSAPVTNRTRIVSAFEADEVRVLKEASPADLLVGGPGLAALALRSAKVRVLASCVPSPRFVSLAQWPFHQTIERCHPLLLGERLDEDPSSEDGADLGKEEFRYPKSRVDRQPFAECSARCGERRSRRQRRRQRLPG